MTRGLVIVLRILTTFFLLAWWSQNLLTWSTNRIFAADGATAIALVIFCVIYTALAMFGALSDPDAGVLRQPPAQLIMLGLLLYTILSFIPNGAANRAYKDLHGLDTLAPLLSIPLMLLPVIIGWNIDSFFRGAYELAMGATRFAYYLFAPHPARTVAGNIATDPRQYSHNLGSALIRHAGWLMRGPARHRAQERAKDAAAIADALEQDTRIAKAAQQLAQAEAMRLDAQRQLQQEKQNRAARRRWWR